MNNPQVYQLYNDLVVGKIVSATDFWKNYVDVSETRGERLTVTLIYSNLSFEPLVQ